jgi:uncharacterized membrane protein
MVSGPVRLRREAAFTISSEIIVPARLVCCLSLAHNIGVSRLNNHLRQTFLAGVLTAVPIAITVYIIWLVDVKTRGITEALFGKPIPFLGLIIAIAAIYLFGLATTSILGKVFVNLLDKLLSRVPILKQLYTSWKQIALTPGGGEGTFAKVVMIPDETGRSRVLGFCSGEPIENDPDTYCVFVPAAPNPINGRLFFVHRDRITFLNVSNEEAFKLLLSTGNYVPPQIGEASRSRIAPQSPAVAVESV